MRRALVLTAVFYLMSVLTVLTGNGWFLLAQVAALIAAIAAWVKLAGLSNAAR